MSTYVVVAAERIQPWLELTHRLRLMRGASRMLTDCTHADRIEPVVSAAGGRLAHDEAGNIAGIVVFTVEDPANALEAGRAVLRHLNLELPLLQWSVWSQQGDSYVDAYDDFVRSQRPPDVRFRAAGLDLTVAAWCPGCGAEPAMHGGPVDRLNRDSADSDEPPDRPYGPGCARRYLTHDAISNEQKSLTPRRARDFEELALRGVPSAEGERQAVGRKDSRSHLAVIAADGNSMGAWFTALREHATHSGDRELLARASARVDRAIKTAARAASSHVNQGEVPAVVYPVERQYLGGDDLLVSLPAVLAWEFAHAVATSFAQITGRLSAALANRALPAPTLGIGIAFAHRAHPFAQSRAQAESAMQAAKRRGQGLESWIGFRDLTVDGEDSWNLGPDTREGVHVVSLADIGADLGDPGSRRSRTLTLPPHAQAQLAGLLREGFGTPAGSARNRVAAVERHRGRLEQVGDVIEPPVEPTEEAAAEWLSGLESLLVRARWWPREPRRYQPSGQREESPC
ncbi:MAG: hypothetical protein R2731_05090 [Nocardioides sp.]